MSGLIFVALVVAVLVLLSKLSECRYQLRQARTQLVQVQQQSNLYERFYEEFVGDLYASTMPIQPNYREVPRRES